VGDGDAPSQRVGPVYNQLRVRVGCSSVVVS
jgi:hypothetical protein